MRTVHKVAVVELESHMKRLTNSLSLMKFVPEGSDSEPQHVSSDLASFRDVSMLEAKLVPLIRTGLSAFDHTQQETKVTVIAGYHHEVKKGSFFLTL